MRSSTLLIGLDFSTQISKRKAYAISLVNEKYERNFDVEMSNLNNKDLSDKLLSLSYNWDEIVLAIDSPMGWPKGMIQDLLNHQAGEKLLNDKKLNRQDYFRRATDKFIIEQVKRTPFSIGADKIAAMAFDALVIVGSIMSEFELDVGYGITKKHKIIEVYPGAMIADQLGSENTKGYKDNKELRKQMYDAIIKRYEVTISKLYPRQEVVHTDDRFDAFLCLLTAIDYYNDKLHDPITGKMVSNIEFEEEVIRKEGWIWSILKNNAHNNA